MASGAWPTPPERDVPRFGSILDSGAASLGRNRDGDGDGEQLSAVTPVRR